MRIFDGRTSFYQWDANQKLISEDLSIDEEVHFSNTLLKQALIVKSYAMEDGTIVVKVPNILLQYPVPITVYRLQVKDDAQFTCKKYQFNVAERPKPSDYIYSETEIYNIKTALDEALKEAKESGEFNGPPGEPGPQGPAGKDYVITEEDKNELKQYTDNKLLGYAKKIFKSGRWVYFSDSGVDAEMQILLNVDANAPETAYAKSHIPARVNGRITVLDAVNPLDCVNKRTFDNAIGDISNALDELHAYAQGIYGGTE